MYPIPRDGDQNTIFLSNTPTSWTFYSPSGLAFLNCSFNVQSSVLNVSFIGVGFTGGPANNGLLNSNNAGFYLFSNCQFTTLAAFALRIVRPISAMTVSLRRVAPS